MSYCTVDDVQTVLAAMNINLSAATAKITTDDVTNEIIPLYDHYIDDRLGRYYQVPITGPRALLTMNRIEKYLCAAEVAQRTYVGQAPSDSPAGATWRTFAENDLKRLVDGSILLTDAQPTAETPEPEDQVISDVLSKQPTGQPAFAADRMRF